MASESKPVTPTTVRPVRGLLAIAASTVLMFGLVSIVNEGVHQYRTWRAGRTWCVTLNPSRIEALQERTQQQIDSKARAIAANNDNTAKAREATTTLARLLRDAVAILMDRLERLEIHPDDCLERWLGRPSMISLSRRNTLLPAAPSANASATSLNTTSGTAFAQSYPTMRKPNPPGRPSPNRSYARESCGTTSKTPKP